MKEEGKIIEKYGKDSGMKLPEGYFPQLEKNILESLPPYPKKESTAPMSRWQRFKPYVYLAAMFCGIWLMMKVFHTATQPLSMGLDNPPEALVELLDGDLDFDSYYMAYQPYSDLDDEEFIMSYDSFDDFAKDFAALN